MADKWTDIANVSILLVGGRWLTRGAFCLEIVHMKQANGEGIYSALVECLKQLQVNRFVGMSFDGASTLLEKNNLGPIRIKTLAPHALFVHCHCHLLQLACIQAANSTNGNWTCMLPWQLCGSSSTLQREWSLIKWSSECLAYWSWRLPNHQIWDGWLTRDVWWLSKQVME